MDYYIGILVKMQCNLKEKNKHINQKNIEHGNIVENVRKYENI